MSLASRIIRSAFHRPQKHAIGLLGTTDIQNDYWMATDFVFLRELIGAEEGKGIWFCGTPFPDDEFLLGDPDCDRIAIRPGPFATCLTSPSRLLSTFILEVKEKAESLSYGDTLVLVLVGHRNLDDSIMLGDLDGRLMKPDLERALLGTKAAVWLIHTGCYSGSWQSPRWTLLADPSPPSSPERTPRNVQEWIHHWSAELSSKSRFRIAPPSHSNIIHSSSLPSPTPLQEMTSNRPAPEEKLLIALAWAFLKSEPLTTTTNIPTIMRCHRLLHGRPLTADEKHGLFSELQDRKKQQVLSLTIASNLGWRKGIASEGRPDKDINDASLEEEAEAGGCPVSVVFGRPQPYRQYKNAARWLARVWKAEGSPRIDPAIWETAVAQAMQLSSEIDTLID